MDCKHVIFSGHAVQRMFERSVQKEEVIAVLTSGEVIADYPDDKPYPSRLMLGCIHGRALHVVVAVDHPTQSCYIITAYPPDPTLWNADFKTRRSS